ncbi:Ig-like domain-containing protein, partial [Pikeienuella sp. HZG-20]|uniref:Ig-like domain-containing protein n=1 Tax=Paludibacillus litoralis TaxID=3133267 RepID=UPI0030EE4AC9
MALPVQSGLVLRVESDRGLATDGTRVTSWDDTSGLGNNLAALGDPTLAAAATPSGAPAIVFDGVGDLLQRVNATDTLNGLPAGAADRTMFFVVNYIDAEGTTSGLVYGDGAKNEAFGLATKNTDQDLLLQGWGGSKFDFDSNVDGPTQGWMVQSVVLKAGMFSHYLDGAEIQSGAHTFATDLKQLVIGGEIAGLGESALEVGAALIYDRALTEPERLQVESFLQSKYLVDDGLNDAPVAVGETAFVIPGGTVAIDILDNDIDDGPLDGASVEILDEPEFGSIAGVDPTTGAVTYVSTASEPTSDSFTYTLTDADGVVSQPATVSISVETAPLSLDGFADDQVLTRAGMNADSPFFLPISMTFLPDNRMLLLSKDGEILIVDPESGASSSFMRLNNIDTGQERGLLDITLDPDFAENGYFYLYYTPDNPEHARISRFTYEENSGGLTATGDVSSEVLVWEDTDGYLSCCHYGGGLDFGPDDKLWLTTSDKFQASTPGEGAAGGSDLPLVASSSSGKVIRVNPDGTAPDGADGQPANPWADPNDGINDYVWGYGLRNPFRARWDEEYGNFYIAEVGGNQQLIAEEDLHIASLDAPGAFFGWPFYEGVDGTYVNGGKSVFNPDNYPDPNGGDGPAYLGDFYSAPIWSLPHEGAVFDPNLNTSASLTGGEVYRGDMFPTEWDGVYFYGDYTRDYIRYLVLDETGTEILGDHAFKPSPELPGTTNEVVSIAVGEDGALYYAMIASGEIRRVTYSDGAMNDAPEIVAAGLTPAAGDLPLTVTFSATVVDDENDPMTYTINFGDGSAPATGVVAGTGMISVDHTYASGGNYAVSFGVSDPGHKTWFAPLQVAAGDANAPPEVIDESASPTVAEANVTEVTFSATAFDPDEDQLTYTWFFGDGGSASGTAETGETITATHVYSFDGAYSAYLQINDGEFTDLSETLNVQVGEPTEVPVTDGLNLLLQSDIKIGLGVGNTVAAWLDGSGQGNNLFAQGDPTLEQNRTPTGQPAIVFDGVGDLLQRVNATDTIFNLPTGAADRTMFLVVKYIDAEGVASGLVYGDGAQNEAFGLTTRYNDNDLLLQGWGASNDFDSNVDGPTQGWLVQSVVLKAGAFSHYLDGEEIQSGAHTFATDLKQLVIGGEIAGLGESALEVGAALIYDRALTEPERMQVESFLQTKYITGSGGANTPPVAQDDSFTMAEDTQLAGDVLADNGAGIDADGDGDALQATLVSGPSNGDLTLNPNGTFTYTPDLNFDASDSFVYQISDGAGGVDQATATIDITPVDDPAVANDDAYTTAQGAALVVGPGSGVLFNDSDPENDPFTVTGVTDSPDSGALSWTPDGGFTYTPT